MEIGRKSELAHVPPIIARSSGKPAEAKMMKYYV